MSQDTLKERASALLELAGIRLNGTAATDLRVHDERLYARVFAHGSLGLGESYMDGWWDADDLPALCTRLLTAGLDQELKTLDTLLAHLKARFLTLQRGERAFEVGKVHYDLGNDLFHAMLGKRMVYSCGYWAKADNLDDAQAGKLDLICRKLQQGRRLRLTEEELDFDRQVVGQLEKLLFVQHAVSAKAGVCAEYRAAAKAVFPGLFQQPLGQQHAVMFGMCVAVEIEVHALS